jgi:hypothetical protein
MVIHWEIRLSRTAPAGAASGTAAAGKILPRPFRIEVGEELLDHLGILDAGDDPHRIFFGTVRFTREAIPGRR